MSIKREVQRVPDNGSIVARERLSREGEVAEVRRVFLYRVEGGMIVEFWLFDEDQPLIDRLWRA